MKKVSKTLILPALLMMMMTGHETYADELKALAEEVEKMHPSQKIGIYLEILNNLNTTCSLRWIAGSHRYLRDQTNKATYGLDHSHDHARVLAGMAMIYQGLKLPMTLEECKDIYSRMGIILDVDPQAADGPDETKLGAFAEEVEKMNPSQKTWAYLGILDDLNRTCPLSGSFHHQLRLVAPRYESDLLLLDQEMVLADMAMNYQRTMLRLQPILERCRETYGKMEILLGID